MNKETEKYLNKIVPGERLWDGHIHLFPPRLLQAIYQVFKDNYGWKLAYNDYHPQLLNHLKYSGIDRASVLTYAHKPDISMEINRWLADLVAEQPWLVPYGCVHPEDNNLQEVLREALDIHNFAGLKIHCMVTRIPPDAEQMFPIYEALSFRNKGLIIHTSTFPLNLPDCVGIDRILNVLGQFPKLRLCIAHLGLYELAKVETLLTQFPQTYLDTAFVFNNHDFKLPDKDIIEIIRRYPNRIIFGSDFPLVLNHPAVDVQNLLKLNFPAEIYSRIFYENARAFLNP